MANSLNGFLYSSQGNPAICSRAFFKDFPEGGHFLKKDLSVKYNILHGGNRGRG